MKKPALCVYRHDLPDVPTGTSTLLDIPEGFWDSRTVLADRLGAFSCEENPELQQLLPYVMIVNERNQVLMYSRGKGGGESKLFSKLSIGFGGHIDGLQQSGQLKEWVLQEARRELEEEAGIVGEVVIEPLALIFDRLYEKEVDDLSKVYVGQVHTGILCVAHCKTSQITKFEENIIEHTQWMDIANFNNECRARLEPWSLLAYQFLKGHL